MIREILSVIKGGISRLRLKGAALKDSAFDIVNGYVTAARTVRVRPGTFQNAILPAGTVGLTGFAGKLHVFSHAALTGGIDGAWESGGDGSFTIDGGAAMFTGGMIMALDGLLSNKVIRSPDGINWSNITGTPPGGSSGHEAVWSDKFGSFWAWAGGTSYSSTDGNSWTPHSTSGAPSGERAAIWIEELELFVIGNEGTNPIFTSPDGINFTQRTSATDSISGLAWNGSILVAVGGEIQTSPDGVTWTTRTGALADSQDIVWSEELGLFAAIRINGIQTSPDGINWTARTFPSVGSMTAIAWNGAVFCVVAQTISTSNVLTSPDGINWAGQLAPAGGWNNLEWFRPGESSGIFVAIRGTGSQDTVITSPDGVTWTERALPVEVGDTRWTSLVVGDAVIAPGTLTGPKVSWAPGSSFTATAGVKAGALGGRVGMSFFDSMGDLIETVYANDFVTETGGEFVDSSVTATAPAGTATAAIVLQAQGSDVDFQTVSALLSDDFVLNILQSPNGDLAIIRIHFAEPFLGFLYVVAEFEDGGVHHYWLQQAEPWEAEHEYSANEFVRPTVDNGLVYRATRLGDPFPSWAPNVPRTVGDRIEPTEYNEYFYEVVETNGDNPRSAPVEPIWPTNTGETIVENSESTEPDTDPNVAPPAPPPPNTPQQPVKDRYNRRGFGSSETP